MLNEEIRLCVYKTPWLLLGDLNEVRNQIEYQGHWNFRPSQCKDLNSFMDSTCLVDLGLNRNSYTWTNAREDDALICERLDHNLAKYYRILVFPSTQVSNLLCSYSDHCSLYRCQY